MSKFVKGDPRAGRKQGVPNKITGKLRDIWREVLTANQDRIQGALDRVEMEEPAKYLEIISRITEYVTPKLARTEVTGKDGAALAVVSFGGKDNAK